MPLGIHGGLVCMRCYCWQWKWKAGFSTQEGHNLLSKALVQVSNYDKMCVKKFCGKYTGILEEESSNIVSIVHKKKENKLEFHEASFLLCIIGNISQSWGSRWGRGKVGGGWEEEIHVLLGQGELPVGNWRAEGATGAQLSLSFPHCLGQRLEE